MTCGEQVINLHGNKIQSIASSVFVDLTKLEVLWLQGNDIVTAPSMGGLVKLKKLYLNYNDIVAIPSSTWLQV